MKAIILIELDDEHLFKQANDLYDRLKGYKCELKPLPKRKSETFDFDASTVSEETINDAFMMRHVHMGWNDCLAEITGEHETD